MITQFLLSVNIFFLMLQIHNILNIIIIKHNHQMVHLVKQLHWNFLFFLYLLNYHNALHVEKIFPKIKNSCVTKSKKLPISVNCMINVNFQNTSSILLSISLVALRPLLLLKKSLNYYSYS